MNECGKGEVRKKTCTNVGRERFLIKHERLWGGGGSVRSVEKGVFNNNEISLTVHNLPPPLTEPVEIW